MTFAPSMVKPRRRVTAATGDLLTPSPTDPEVMARAWYLASHDAPGAIAQIGEPKLGAWGYVQWAYAEAVANRG